MAGTSLVIVGFSFVTMDGCECIRVLSILATQPECEVPRDGANHAWSHNRWSNPFCSRSGLRGQNIPRGSVPTPIVQGYLMRCGDFLSLTKPGIHGPWV